MVDRIVRKSEAARLLGLSPTSLWRLERSGALRAVKVMPGLFGFRESELQAFVESRERAVPDRARVAAALQARGVTSETVGAAEATHERV